MIGNRKTICASVDILLSVHISYNNGGTGQSLFGSVRNFHFNSIIKNDREREREGERHIFPLMLCSKSCPPALSVCMTWHQIQKEMQPDYLIRYSFS